MIWLLLDRSASPETLGFVPGFLSEDDPRPAAEQFNAHYIIGWRPQPKFKMDRNGVLRYPSDPPLRPIAMSTLRGETIRFYPHAYVSVTQTDGSFEVCRMD